MFSVLWGKSFSRTTFLNIIHWVDKFGKDFGLIPRLENPLITYIYFHHGWYWGKTFTSDLKWKLWQVKQLKTNLSYTQENKCRKLRLLNRFQTMRYNRAFSILLYMMNVEWMFLTFPTLYFILRKENNVCHVSLWWADLTWIMKNIKKINE